jgi:hypothetical protein
VLIFFISLVYTYLQITEPLPSCIPKQQAQFGAVNAVQKVWCLPNKTKKAAREKIAYIRLCIIQIRLLMHEQARFKTFIYLTER